MLTAFIMILAGALIIGWCTTNRREILAKLWLLVGYRLFEIVAIYSDEDTGDCYGVTFTNDEQWIDKMMKDLKEMEEKQDRPEGQ
jgi:hypothetical protein